MVDLEARRARTHDRQHRQDPNIKAKTESTLGLVVDHVDDLLDDTGRIAGFHVVEAGLEGISFGIIPCGIRAW